MTPYASPVDRAKALYRIPTAPRRNRTLEVCCGRAPFVLAGPWHGSGHACLTIGALPPTEAVCSEDVERFHQADLSAPLPWASQSFDLIVLHRTLEDLSAPSQAASFDVKGFLAQIGKVLAPGGVVAGCLQNRHSLRWIAGRAARRLGASVPHEHAAYSVRELRNLLETAPLVGSRIFSLLPNCDSPLRLVDTDPKISRLMFRHELIAARSRPLPYFAKRVAVELGLYGTLVTRAIFFWACKPC
jgi:SAM-dependent methyltransferase